MQVQQRQHLGHPRRLACPRGQDRRSEPFPLPSGRIGALVVDPRRPHRHRARRDHLAFVVMTVADHQPVTILIDLLGMGDDVGRHLRLQGDREHLPRSLAHDLIEHRTARLVGLGLVVDYFDCADFVIVPTSRNEPQLITDDEPVEVGTIRGLLQRRQLGPGQIPANGRDADRRNFGVCGGSVRPLSPRSASEASARATRLCRPLRSDPLPGSRSSFKVGTTKTSAQSRLCPTSAQRRAWAYLPDRRANAGT